MLKKIILFVFALSVLGNFLGVFILDKALFYHKHLSFIENSDINHGMHIPSVKELLGFREKKIAAFVGGSFVKFWQFRHDLPVRVSNQGGVEDKITDDFAKLENDIMGTGIDYLFINSGFCEIHTAINSQKDVDKVIRDNYRLLIKMVDMSKKDGITPVLTTLTPVRPVFLFPYSRLISISSKKKELENQAIEKYNNLIRTFALEDNIFLIDFHSLLKDENGILKKDFSITDGEHIDMEGYRFLEPILHSEMERLLTTSKK